MITSTSNQRVKELSQIQKKVKYAAAKESLLRKESAWSEKHLMSAW